MIVVRLQGGLGNQLFQFAFGLNLEHRMQAPVQYDISSLTSPPPRPDITRREYMLDIFDGPKMISSLSESELDGFTHVVEPEQFRFHPIAGLVGSYERHNLYFSGYWQHPRYAGDVKPALLAGLQPAPSQRTPDIIAMEQEIRSCTAVAVHFRRGDYAAVPSVRARHGVQGLDYFELARTVMQKHHPEARYFLFSDDVPWLEEHFQHDDRVRIVPEALAGAKSGGHFLLMRTCRHFIISNSTFSWWAAWLSGADHGSTGTVLAPRCWMSGLDVDTSEIIPAGWTWIP